LVFQCDGPAGEIFQHAAAKFCARQQIALESLKERRRKDAKLNIFLTDAEGNPMCRRLQLKDIIPTAMQRSVVAAGLLHCPIFSLIELRI